MWFLNVCQEKRQERGTLSVYVYAHPGKDAVHVRGRIQLLHPRTGVELVLSFSFLYYSFK
jgi:hypothetical protein